MQTEAAHKGGLHVREVLGDFLSWLALDHDLLLPKVHYEHLLAARLYATERALMVKDSYGYSYGSFDSSRVSASERAPGSKDTRLSLASSRENIAEDSLPCRNPCDTLRSGGRGLEHGDPPRRGFEGFADSPSLFSERNPSPRDLNASSPSAAERSGLPGGERSGHSDNGKVVRTSPFDVRSLLGKRTRGARDGEEEGEKKSPSEDRRRFLGQFQPQLHSGDFYYSAGLYDKLNNVLKTGGLSPHALMLPPPPSPVVPHPLIPSPPHAFGRLEDFPACSCPRCVPRGDSKSSPSASPSSSSATSPESSRSEGVLFG